MKQYTVAEAAAISFKAERTIRQLAATHNIGRRFGRAWVFTDADIARLRAIGRGRPSKTRKRRAQPAPLSLAAAVADGSLVPAPAILGDGRIVADASAPPPADVVIVSVTE